jgi:hypothetical protein
VCVCVGGCWVGVCAWVCGCVERSKQEPEVGVCWYIINIYFGFNVSVKILYAFQVSSVRAKNALTFSSCSGIILFGTL